MQTVSESEAAAFAAEQAAVGGGAVLGEVVAQQAGERWGDRHRADLFDGAVFEVAAFAAGAGFVPGTSGGGGRLAEVEPSPLAVAVR